MKSLKPIFNKFKVTAKKLVHDVLVVTALLVVVVFIVNFISSANKANTNKKDVLTEMLASSTDSTESKSSTESNVASDVSSSVHSKACSGASQVSSQCKAVKHTVPSSNSKGIHSSNTQTEYKPGTCQYSRLASSLYSNSVIPNVNITTKQLNTEFPNLLYKAETYSTNTAAGNYNMKLALCRLNNTVVMPNGVISFLRICGSSKDDGYKQAGAISAGARVLEYGGGICEAATTVYDAASYSGLQIVDRSNHQLKAHYVDMGLDAMVSSGTNDLKIKNNSGKPILIQAGMNGNTTWCAIKSIHSTEWDKVSVLTNIVRVYPVLTLSSVVHSNVVARGDKELLTSARKGYSVSACRIYWKMGNKVKSDMLPMSYYPATGNIYGIGD